AVADVPAFLHQLGQLLGRREGQPDRGVDEQIEGLLHGRLVAVAHGPRPYRPGAGCERRRRRPRAAGPTDKRAAADPALPVARSTAELAEQAPLASSKFTRNRDTAFGRDPQVGSGVSPGSRTGRRTRPAAWAG